MVLRETYNFKDKVMQTNHRKVCFGDYGESQRYEALVWQDQEYTLFDVDQHPFG